MCAPYKGKVFGRAFFDIFDEAVEYHQVPHLPYHSFIRGDRFRIETDAQGRPILIEVRCTPNRRGQLEDTLIVPAHVTRGSLRLLDLRILCHEDTVRIDARNSLVYIKLNGSAATDFISTAPGIIWGVNRHSQLCGLWISGWQNDPSGLVRARWRRRSWAKLHSRVSARRRPGGIISVSASQAKDFPISTIFA